MASRRARRLSPPDSWGAGGAAGAAAAAAAAAGAAAAAAATAGGAAGATGAAGPAAAGTAAPATAAGAGCSTPRAGKIPERAPMTRLCWSGCKRANIAGGDRPAAFAAAAAPATTCWAAVAATGWGAVAACWAGVAAAPATTCWAATGGGGLSGRGGRDDALEALFGGPAMAPIAASGRPNAGPAALAADAFAS